MLNLWEVSKERDFVASFPGRWVDVCYIRVRCQQSSSVEQQLEATVGNPRQLCSFAPHRLLAISATLVDLEVMEYT